MSGDKGKVIKGEGAKEGEREVETDRERKREREVFVCALLNQANNVGRVNKKASLACGKWLPPLIWT